LYPKTGVALGPIAIAALKNINAHKLIMSVGGITEKGLFNSNAVVGRNRTANDASRR
jgi:DeoR family transcriptional regulator, fructose operon transcriptional repressor